MFMLLPGFALWMKLAYWNRNLRHTEHLVFALHVHAFWFLAVAFALAFTKVWWLTAAGLHRGAGIDRAGHAPRRWWQARPAVVARRVGEPALPGDADPGADPGADPDADAGGVVDAVVLTPRAPPAPRFNARCSQAVRRHGRVRDGDRARHVALKMRAATRCLASAVERCRQARQACPRDRRHA